MKNGERIDRILAEIMKEIKPDQDEENSWNERGIV
jgi:hypothetical protein